MNLYQDRLILGALIISESIWLYVIYAVLGIIVGVSHSPIPWGLCALLYGSSMYLSKGISFFRITNSLAFLIQAVLGAILVYVTVGYLQVPDKAGFSIGWIGGVGEWEYPGEEVGVTIVLAFFFSAFSWLKGGLSSGTDYPLESLSRSFMLGILVLAAGTIIDAFHNSDLGLTFLMFLFFITSLSGLAVGRIRPSMISSTSKSIWIKVIGLVIVLIAGAGVLFSFIQRDILDSIATPIIMLLGWILNAFIYLIVIPIAYLAEYLVKGLLWIFGDPVSAEEYVSRQGGSFELGMSARKIVQPDGEGTSSIFSEVFEIFIILVGASLIIALLGFAFSRRIIWLRKPQESDRVINSENLHPFLDLWRLARELLPSMGNSPNRSKGFNIPAGINEDTKSVLENYYRMLEKASRKGVKRTIDSTPVEMVPTLSTVFRYNSVRDITYSFVRACYGRKKIERQEAANVRMLFSDLESDPD